MKIIHFCAGLQGWNGMANTARQFVAEELARGDESLLTNDVREIERTEKVDRVHIHGTWLPVLWKVAKLAKKKGAELIVRPCGNYDPIRIRRGAIKRLKKWLVGPFEHAMLDRADFVQCTCTAEAEWVKAYHPRARIQMTDLKRFFNIVRLFNCSDCSIEKKRNLHVLYLGRRDPLKGVEFLEKAVDEVNATPEQSNNPNNRTIDLRIVSNHFGEELERDWEWCDVLVLPTLSENFGRVVAEALERGRRVITTDGAPVWEDQPGVLYLKGYVAATPAERVRMIAGALRKMV